MATLVNSEQRRSLLGFNGSTICNLLGQAVWVLVVLFCCVSASCIQPSMSNECREFFSLPLDQRGSVISTYPLEKQLRLNRCGLDRRPPDRYLARYIADRGTIAIPALLEKLESEEDELSKYGIVEIFREMSAKGFLRNREDVIGRIRSVVLRMKISTFQEKAQEDLDEIEKNSRD